MSKDERLDHFQLYNQENFREKVATELALRDVQEFFRVEISILSVRLKNLDFVLRQRKTKLLQIRKDQSKMHKNQQNEFLAPTQEEK